VRLTNVLLQSFLLVCFMPFPLLPFFLSLVQGFLFSCCFFTFAFLSTPVFNCWFPPFPKPPTKCVGLLLEKRDTHTVVLDRDLFLFSPSLCLVLP